MNIKYSYIIAIGAFLLRLSRKEYPYVGISMNL